jgi:hypothetical protein
MKNEGINYMENLCKEHEGMYSKLEEEIGQLDTSSGSLEKNMLYLEDQSKKFELLQEKSTIYGLFVDAINHYSTRNDAMTKLLNKSSELYEKDNLLGDKMIYQRKILTRRFPENFKAFLENHPDFLDKK